MTRKIRKQFFITAEQNRRLKECAAATGVSEGELIRAGIDMRLNRRVHETDSRTLIERLSGAWAERDDLDELLQKNRQGWRRRLKRLGLARD
jgi:hypothetical protein